MTEDEILAGSIKYASSVRAFIGEIRPGLFALWHVDATLLLLTEDWNEVLATYRSRAEIVPRAQVRTEINKLGIDLTTLEINI